LAGHTKMAQTGYTPISIYYSATTTNIPTAGNLVAGELAINTADGKLFYKDSSGVVQVIGTKGGVGSSTTTQVLYNSSGLVVGSANMTFNGTSLTLANDASISGLTVGKGGGSAAFNTVVGQGAGAATNTIGYSSLFGYQAGAAVTSGLLTAVGYQAGLSVTTSQFNSAFGTLSLTNTTTGDYNSASGRQSLQANTTGSYNSAFGMQSLASNTTASNNTAVGYNAGYSITTGGNNTILGQNSGFTLTTGTGCTYLGYNVGASSSSATNELAIATQSGTVGKGSNTGYINSGGGMYQGNNSTLWSITSDQRLKKNIIDNTDGLNKITAIQVRNFEYRTKDEITELEPQNAIDIKGVQLGAIAQELQAILPDCVKTESTGVMSVDASNLTWYLINAVKELNAKLEAQALEIATLKGQ